MTILLTRAAGRIGSARADGLRVARLIDEVLARS
jgi:hypothetical protein